MAGERLPEAMTPLNVQAVRAALEAGVECATDITGFGLLGHLHKLARASGVTAMIDATAVPYVDGACQTAKSAEARGATSTGSARTST